MFQPDQILKNNLSLTPNHVSCVNGVAFSRFGASFGTYSSTRSGVEEKNTSASQADFLFFP